ncbi:MULTISPECIES: Csu type fimbrial protein [Achromobacter]|jgi:spore coat protein U-like protein|uniref:Spore coat U domain-containing protein n=1 Tax=Achromobacter aegrifaciens TaxID=1287736 RepID=A0AAD2KJG5_ACHAE|nr:MULTISPECIES: spore coat U domain-containing protein [Achromobacter]PTN49397.1 spore coat U domain-containing protein [Achromobacter xylosoxidans]MBD9420317.1 spore coat U domain-containing protein [Achromobacter sp. ACM04]MBD9430808.1 spore coat U domain-containing protein [Achromobacter sp. ACM03]MBD9472374.1 spore coat U domain-containing protein [Achromobacter sp. ACM01]MDQ1761940.1 spore coat U domain-containing protein [Achromobacter aegrifaciens]
MKAIGSAAILSATIGLSLPAAAPAQVYQNGTATATFNVSLTVQANCTIAADPLVFPSTGLLSAAVNQETTVRVTCTNTTPYNVGLDAGTAAGSTIANRLLVGTAPGNTTTSVGYQLYQNAGRTTIWGNTQGTDTVGGTGTGAAQTLTVYGRVPPQAAPKPDTYQSTVTATVYF